MIDQTAEALTDLGNMAMLQRNDALARELYEEGLAIWRALDYEPGIVHLLEKLDQEAAHRQWLRLGLATESLVENGRLEEAPGRAALALVRQTPSRE
jgi:hypothetical protein